VSFNGYANPDQLKVMSQALSEYCRANGIEENTPSYEEAAELVVILFQTGIASADELSKALQAKHSSDQAARRA
jgi:hypothetical protein